MTDAAIGLIIQARMGSTRLPGKVLKKINHLTVLEFLVKRLDMVQQYADSGIMPEFKTIVATSDAPDDEAIEDMCKSIGCVCYRGSENDVLSRYIEAAKENDVEVIVRICADSPLIDPFGVLEMLEALYQNPDVHLVHNKHPAGYPFGTGGETFTLSTLQNILPQTTEDQHREHVLTYMTGNPDRFKIMKLNAPEELIRPNYFFTIDYPEDLELMRTLLVKVPGPDKHKVRLKEVIQILDKDPAIPNMNAHLHEGFK